MIGLSKLISYLFYCSCPRPRRPYRRAALELGEAPSRFYTESLADSDPGHREARAGRVRLHDKLLRPTVTGCDRHHESRLERKPFDQPGSLRAAVTAVGSGENLKLTRPRLALPPGDSVLTAP